MTACIYIRLSSADNDIRSKRESDSVANQRSLLHQYIANHKEFAGYNVVEFVDDGFTGTNGNRPAFERMISYLKQGRAKLVLCKDLSRFFRNYLEIGEYLERIFPVLGVRLIAVNDGYDSDDYKGTTAGIDVVMKCIMYSLYSRDLSAKVRTAMELRQRKGMFLGPYAPYGFLRDPADKHHLIADPVAAPIVQRIFQMADQGVSTVDIARTLNREHVEMPGLHMKRLYPDNRQFISLDPKSSLWNSSNVMRILRRLVYTGANDSRRILYKSIRRDFSSTQEREKWIVVPGCHEVIVSQEVYDSVQEKLGKLNNQGRLKKSHIFSGLIYCGICGHALTYCKSKREGDYFICNTSRYKETSLCSVKERFRSKTLEETVMQSLRAIVDAAEENEKRVQAIVSKEQSSRDELQREIQLIAQRISRNSENKRAAYERYSSGQLTKEAFLEIRNTLIASTDELLQRKKGLEEQLSSLEQAEDESVSHEVEGWGSEFFEETAISNQGLKQVIRRIEVFPGMNLRITYRFKNPFLIAAAEKHK